MTRKPDGDMVYDSREEAKKAMLAQAQGRRMTEQTKLQDNNLRSDFQGVQTNKIG